MARKKSTKTEAQKPKPEEETRLRKAKETVVRAAEVVVEAVKDAAVGVKKRLVRAVKVKKPRYKREKKVEKLAAKPVVLPNRSKKPTAKIMSQNLAMPPKEKPNPGGLK